jgi:hypothetical protein
MDELIVQPTGVTRLAKSGTTRKVDHSQRIIENRLGFALANCEHFLTMSLVAFTHQDLMHLIGR